MNTCEESRAFHAPEDICDSIYVGLIPSVNSTGWTEYEGMLWVPELKASRRVHSI